MGIKDYARIWQRSWTWVVAGAVLGPLLAGLITAAITRQYAATSAAVVSIDRSGTVSELTQGNAFTERRVATYAQLATEPIVTQPVIEEFDLKVTPSEFANRITVTVPVDTTVLEITVRDASPTVASSLSNAMMANLKETVADIETTTSSTTSRGPVAPPTPPVKVTQVRFAEIPSAAVTPNVPLNLIIGLFAGLAIGTLAAILRDVFDTRVKTVDELKTLSSAPVVGVIPQRPKTRSDDLTPGPAGDPFDESFRILRTNLQFLEPGRPSTYALTSATDVEGKTTVLANLATSIAANGSRVLVVDADLREPRVSELFDVDADTGLTDILIGRSSFSDAVRHWGERVDVLTAGTVPPNPSELLGSSTMKELAAGLEGRYDVVLYDTAAILPSPDASIISRLVGGVLLVASIELSKREQVTGAAEALEKVNARVSGLIVNHRPAKAERPAGEEAALPAGQTAQVGPRVEAGPQAG